MAKVKLSTEVEKLQEQSIIIEGAERDYTIEHPLLWPDDKADEVVAAAKAGDLEKVGRLLLGDDFGPFTAEGGTARLALKIWQSQLGELGESSAS